ncbi:MAG: response regulator transcription factor [Rhodospirillales bacterium]|nr:response regulator transcription factor [Rhodospirillales bacterium]
MRILLIEDDLRVARFVEKGLAAERFQIEHAADGGKGVELGLSGTYDLILLDLILPVKTGIEVCQELRGENIMTPILMLTAKDTIEDKVTGLGVGADDYLTKPFAFEELLARIQALLRRPGEMDVAPSLIIADLVMDKNTHEVKRAGELITLTPTEFTLLEYLMRNQNRVLSRTMIEEQVWDYQNDPLTNVVDVYIRRLRQKVDQGYDRQLIHTVRGVGYTLKT